MSNNTRPHAHDLGLGHDLLTLRNALKQARLGAAKRAEGRAAEEIPLGCRAISRRSLLRWGAGASLVTLVGCPTSEGVSTIGGTASAENNAAGSCSTIPEETAGPYPGDGSNGVNALVLDGIVRSDIRSSFAGASGIAQGVPLTVTLTLVDPRDNCSPLAGCAVYLWHCDRDGNYSLYSRAVLNENYLRGLQEADENGEVKFQTIFPGCYSGRWPHIHFEVYESLAAATSGSGKLATSQLALPQTSCQEVYATNGYETSVRNLSSISLASDNVFSDGSSEQLAAMSGSVGTGLWARLTVGVNLSA